MWFLPSGGQFHFCSSFTLTHLHLVLYEAHQISYQRLFCWVGRARGAENTWPSPNTSNQVLFTSYVSTSDTIWCFSFWFCEQKKNEQFFWEAWATSASNRVKTVNLTQVNWVKLYIYALCGAVCCYSWTANVTVLSSFLPLALVPAPLWNSWQPRHRIVTALKILRRLLRYDPDKLFVVGLVAFSWAVFGHALGHMLFPVEQLPITDLLRQEKSRVIQNQKYRNCSKTRNTEIVPKPEI